ncbi:DUF2441 domain-containing protein [Rhizobium ruizarguesonis]
MPFHVTQAYLENGSVVLPGNYGRIIRDAGQAHNLALRESILEHIRETEFQNLPSRLDVAYYLDNLHQAVTYMAVENLVYLNVYEVERLEPSSPEARLDHRAVRPIGAVDFNWAQNYWAGQSYPVHSPLPAESYRETFSTSRLQILRRIPADELQEAV